MTLLNQRRLTDLFVQKIKPDTVRREIPDRQQRGLYLIVQPSGKKSFAVRYRFAGQPRKLTLTSGLSLADARKAAAEAAHEIDKGKDPRKAQLAIKERARAAASNTLRSICENYLRREGDKLRTKAQREAILDRLVYPVLGNRPIDSIRRGEITDLLDKIEDNNGPRMADMTLAILRKIMRWHSRRTDDYRSPIVPGMARTNPKDSVRSRVLSDDELRKIWNACCKSDNTFGALVRFLLLTAARRTEASAMERGEVKGSDWILPAARNKVKVDLLRPLSRPAQEILRNRPHIKGCDFVFTNDGIHPLSGFGKFKEKIDELSGVNDWTLHDLRRTARSLMSRAGIDSDHAERCLGHVITGVRATYDRHEFYEEKKRAFEALAAIIQRVISPSRQSNITQFRRSKSK